MHHDTYFNPSSSNRFLSPLNIAKSLQSGGAGFQAAFFAFTLPVEINTHLGGTDVKREWTALFCILNLLTLSLENWVQEFRRDTQNFEPSLATSNIAPASRFC